MKTQAELKRALSFLTHAHKDTLRSLKRQRGTKRDYLTAQLDWIEREQDRIVKTLNDSARQERFDKNKYPKPLDINKSIE